MDDAGGQIGSGQPSAPVDVDDVSLRLMGAGAIAVVVGAFLPWADISIFGTTVHKAGTAGDGQITFAGGIVVGIIVLTMRDRSASRRTVMAALVVSALCLAVGAYDTIDVGARFTSSSLLSVSVGIGLWVTDAGALIAAAGALRSLLAGRRRVSEP